MPSLTASRPIARVAIACVTALLLSSTAAMAEPLRIFLAHAQRQDPQTDTAAAVADEFRRQVDTLSQGRIKIEILAEGVVGGNRDTTALVEKGVIHSALVTVGGVTPIHPPMAVIQTPFAFDSLDQAHRVLDGPFGRRLGDDLAARTRLRLFGFVDPGGFHVLTNSARPVRNPADMKGLRIRAIPGSKPLEAMIAGAGAAPVKVSSREELSALSSRAIDGQMNPAPAVLARGLDTAQRYATLTNHLYAPYLWVFNKQAFDALPPEDAQLLTKAAQAALARGHTQALALWDSPRGVPGLKKRLDVYTPSPAERAAFAAAMGPPTEKAIAAEIGEGGTEWLRAFREAAGKRGR